MTKRQPFLMSPLVFTLKMVWIAKETVFLMRTWMVFVMEMKSLDARMLWQTTSTMKLQMTTVLACILLLDV